MAGRRPLPTAIKLLRGDGRRGAGHRALPKREPKPIIGAQPAPEWLVPEARALWDELAAMLVRTRVLTEADRPALELLCATWAQWKCAAQVLAEHGDSVQIEGKHGPRLVGRPEVQIAAAAGQRLRLLMGEFGLTPSSRARVSTAGEEQEIDPMDELLSRRGA